VKRIDNDKVLLPTWSLSQDEAGLRRSGMLEHQKSDPQFPFQRPSPPPVEHSCQQAASTDF